MAPAHATVDSTLEKFRMPGTSCFTTWAAAADAARHTAIVATAILGLMILTQTSRAEFTAWRDRRKRDNRADAERRERHGHATARVVSWSGLARRAGVVRRPPPRFCPVCAELEGAADGRRPARS